MRPWKNKNGKIGINFCYKFIWSDIEKYMKKLSYPHEQFEYLIDVASTYNSLAITGKMSKINNDITYLDCIDMEMKRLNAMCKLNTGSYKGSTLGLENGGKAQKLGEIPPVKCYALAIYYLQISGEMKEFEDGKKKKQIDDLTKGKCSAKTFQQNYNKISSSGSEANRLKILRFQKNQVFIKNFLEGKKAIARLNIDINKARNPLT